MSANHAGARGIEKGEDRAERIAELIASGRELLVSRRTELAEEWARDAAAWRTTASDFLRRTPLGQAQSCGFAERVRLEGIAGGVAALAALEDRLRHDR